MQVPKVILFLLNWKCYVLCAPCGAGLQSFFKFFRDLVLKDLGDGIFDDLYGKSFRETTPFYMLLHVAFGGASLPVFGIVFSLHFDPMCSSTLYQLVVFCNFSFIITVFPTIVSGVMFSISFEPSFVLSPTFLLLPSLLL